MKKLHCLITIIILSVFLSACGNGTSSNNSSYSSDITTTEKFAEETYSDMDIIAAKFCMAYMNHLKNPYSFNAKSIWAYKSPTGGYHIQVKFTATNSFGGEIVSEITNNIPITDSVLDTIADTEHITSTLYIEEGQNERNNGKNGEWLDVQKVQKYIYDNYK